MKLSLAIKQCLLSQLRVLKGELIKEGRADRKSNVSTFNRCNIADVMLKNHLWRIK